MATATGQLTHTSHPTKGGNLLSLETPRHTGIAHPSKKNVTKLEKNEQTEGPSGFGH